MMTIRNPDEQPATPSGGSAPARDARVPIAEVPSDGPTVATAHGAASGERVMVADREPRPPANGLGPRRSGPVPGAGDPAAVDAAAPGRPDVVSDVDVEVLRARAYLSRVAEPPAAALGGFVAQVGAVEAAERVRRGAVPDAVRASTGARRTVDRVSADLEAAAAAGARLLVPEHPDWPHWAFGAFDNTGVPELAAPLALWVRGPGSLSEASDRAVAIVGARAATGYGVHVAGDLATALAAAGYSVVSGAAFGIDAAAHRGALAARHPTVAVMACGLDRAYPAAHSELIERIAATGLVVSEYPPGAVPARHRFLVRNRLLAGIGSGTLVVEAGVRSGAHRTAADARALGRVVMAVPGPITSGLSAGCHELVRNGAMLVTRAEEVLEAVGRLGVDLAVERARPTRATDHLDPVQAAVHDALPTRAARNPRWLAMEAGLPLDVVRTGLLELERLGLAEYRDGLWQRALPRR